MNELIDERPEIRSYAALEDMLELQRRMIETTREMSWLVQRCRTSPAPERPRLHAQLDEIAAVLTEYAQQIGEISTRYRNGA